MLLQNTPAFERPVLRIFWMLEAPWSFPTWQVANEPELFPYKGKNGWDGICLIERIDLPDGRIVIAAIQVPGNPGNSITNSAEVLCFQVCERFRVNAHKFMSAGRNITTTTATSSGHS